MVRRCQKAGHHCESNHIIVRRSHPSCSQNHLYQLPHCLLVVSKTEQTQFLLEGEDIFGCEGKRPQWTESFAVVVKTNYRLDF